MKSGALVAVIVAAAVAGVVGYLFGKGARPGTPGVTVPGGPTCAATAQLIYDPAATPPLRLTKKPIEVERPDRDAASWGVCWTLEVHGEDPKPFDQIKLDVAQLGGLHGKPVLVGDTNFKGRETVWVRFGDEPMWSAGADPSVTVAYDIVARLKDSTSNLGYDPEIVIKKPRI